MTADPFSRSFALDGFQLEAAEAIASDENVLVSAPTGSGKTVVAETAISRALETGLRCFYTAPIKALSNQKFNDLVAVMGEDRVGLLTGDHAINPDAPVVVMTTEVLRNMTYANSAALHDLGWVVLDEVHFLSDAYRGPVWEEVLIHTPPKVRFVCLSATVSNAAELGDWITSLRGPTRTVVEHKRPVSLDSHLLVGDRSTEQQHLVPLLVKGRPNPQGRRFDQDRPSGMQGRRPRSRFYTPRRGEVVERLRSEGLIPAIYFIFSRNACDDAAKRCAEINVGLTTKAERVRIRQIVESRTTHMSDEDLAVLGYDSFLATLESGIAAHHAGMVPPFREAVELCFVEGLIKVVFATETLAMGINMPAKSVVIEKLTKFNGESHEPLSPSLYTQLTGRAGRRGIDHEGHAIVLWSPFTTFEQVAELAASRDWQLQSSFRPNYNMAANLIDRYDHDEAFQVLGLSFAQFQAERAVHELNVERERHQAEVSAVEQKLAESPEIEIFDVAGFVELHERLDKLRKKRRSQRFDTDRFLGSLRPGDILELNIDGKNLLRVVLSVSTRRGGSARLSTVDSHGHRLQVTSESDWAFAQMVGRLDLPVPYLPKDREFRAEAGRRLQRLNPKKLRRRASNQRPTSTTDHSLQELRSQLREHPLEGHPEQDRLISEYRDLLKSRQSLNKIDSKIKRSGKTLTSRLEAILEVLEATHHCEGWLLTESGERLRRIYHETDLLISMAISQGLLDDLDHAALAALVSCFTYEHRSSTPAPDPVIPTAKLRVRYPALLKLWKQLERTENRIGTPSTREPQGGFMSSAWSWASGQELHLIIDEDLSGGDFVRNTRQLMDLLDQLSHVCPDPVTARSARTAAEAIRRGVVLSTGGPL